MRKTIAIVLALGLSTLSGSAFASFDAKQTRVVVQPIVTPRVTTTPVLVVRPTPSPAPAPVQPAPAPAPAPAPGSLSCAAEENGIVAAASVELRRAGSSEIVASGTCGSPLRVPAGAYVAAIRLDTAMDRPVQNVSVEVPAGGAVTARARFTTAILEVRFTKDRAAVQGIATITQNGHVIGTLGSGITTRLSAGTYEVTARYRTEVRTFTVTLAADQRRALRADF